MTPTRETRAAEPAELVDRLRNRPALRLTAQRRAVAQVLSGAHVHLTAEEVHERARQVLPEISLATVYNALRDFVALGEIQEVSLDGRLRRYDPNVGHAHHHLICSTCGTILDVTPGQEPPSLPASERHGFQVDAADVTYRGTCGACREAGDVAD